MDSLSHILCVRCYSAVGKDHEVLLCNSCRLWQHRKCSKGVSERFYLEFYLTTVLGQKPSPWICHYCSQQKQRVKDEPESPKKTEPTKSKETDHMSSLQLPPIPPSQIDYEDSEYDSDSSSFDEFSFTCEIQQNEREGPEPDVLQLGSHTSVDANSIPVPENSITIIKAQPIISDTARQPTLYTLYKTTSGHKKVKDSLGNDLTVTGTICDGVATYKCARAECGFKVRVCESIKEFLSAGSQSSGGHTHNSSTSNLATNSRNRSLDTSSSSSSSSSDEDSPRIPCSSTSNIATNSRNRSLDTSSSSSSSSSNEDSPRIPCRVYNFSDSTSSDSSDDEDSNPRPLSTTITKFSALTTPTQKYTWPDASSSDSDSNDSDSSDSDSNDESGLSALVDIINESLLNASDPSDESRTSAVIDHLNVCDETYTVSNPSSPASTIPALDSSDSEEDNVNTTTTYQVTIGTRNGERDLLTDNLGYTFNIKFKLEARTFWCCTEVLKQCPASVIQNKRGNFTTGVASHNHPSVQSEIKTSSSRPLDQSKTLEPQIKNQQTTPTSETTIQKSGSSEITEAEPETIIDVTALSEKIVYYETEACLPRLKKLRSILLSSDGFIFKHKLEDSTNNTTHWHCTEKASNGVCKASLVFKSQQPFTLSTDNSDSPTWLINRECGMYTTQHNHVADHSLVTLAKVRMMIQRRIFLNGMLNEAPNTIIESIFQGFDYEEHVYLDSTGNAFLTALDKDYLPSSPFYIKTLKTFIARQKSSYKQVRKHE